MGTTAGAEFKLSRSHPPLGQSKVVAMVLWEAQFSTLGGSCLLLTTCHLLILYGPAISWWTPSTDLLALASSVPRRSFLHSNVAGVILDLKQEQKRRQMQILYSNFQTSLPVPPLRVLYSCLSREGGRPQMQFFEPIFHNIFQKSDRNPRTHATHLLPRAYDGRNRVTILMCEYFLRLTLNYI